MVPRWVYYAGGAGVFLILLVALFMLRPAEEDKEADVAQSDVPQIVLEEVEPFDGASEKPVPAETGAEEKEQVPEKPEPQVQELHPTPTKKKQEQETARQETVVPQAVVLPEAPEIVPVEPDSVEKSPEPEKVETEDTGQKEESEVASIVDESAEEAGDVFAEIVAESQGEEPAVEAEIPKEQPAVEIEIPKEEPPEKPPEKRIVEQQEEKKDLSDSSTISTVKQPQHPEPVKILREDTKRKPEETRVSTDSGTQQPMVKDSGALFRERLAAGARWLVGGGGKYTVQLMVLTSENAEQNLVNMLETKEYRDIADQLYVLRRKEPILTVMVFYGEYPTLSAARNARNNLPVFLRKHHPYAISVQGAVTKAQTVE